MRVFLLYYMKVHLLHFCVVISPPIYTYWWEFFLLGISWIWWIWWWISAFVWHRCLPVCFLLNGRLPATTRHIHCVLGLVQLTVFQNNNKRNKLLKSLILPFIAVQIARNLLDIKCPDVCGPKILAQEICNQFVQFKTERENNKLIVILSNKFYLACLMWFSFFFFTDIWWTRADSR